jgi:two-component system KDP operon response regulator KdpE
MGAAINERNEMSSSPEKVLIIAKEARVRSRLRRTLEALGFDAGEAPEGGGASVRLRMIAYEAIIVEHRRYAVDGVATCKRLRGLHPRLPILVIATSISRTKKLAILDAGADDCMICPLAEREIGVRLRSAIRRFHAAAAGSCESLVIGEIALDPVRRRVEKAGSDLALTPTEFRALEALMRQPGIPISHSALIAMICGPEAKAKREHLRVVISCLRKKIEDDPSDPGYLITHSHFGYTFRDH